MKSIIFYILISIPIFGFIYLEIHHKEYPDFSTSDIKSAIDNECGNGMTQLCYDELLNARDFKIITNVEFISDINKEVS